MMGSNFGEVAGTKLVTTLVRVATFIGLAFGAGAMALIWLGVEIVERLK